MAYYIGGERLGPPSDTKPGRATVLLFRVAWVEVKRVWPRPALPSAQSYLGSVATVALYTGMVIVAGADVLLWQPIGILMVAFLLLLTGDLLTEYYGLPPSQRGLFIWEREVTGRMMLIVLVVISLVLDMVIYQVARHFPHDYALLDRGYLFVTLTTLLWLIGAMVTRITRNIATSEGDEVVPPTLKIVARQIQWVLKSMKLIDRGRARAADVVVNNHPKRWYDEITEEEVRELAIFLEGRRQKPPGAVQPMDTSNHVPPMQQEPPE